jgi:hypothetical protein
MADLSTVVLQSTHVPFDAMRGLLAIEILLSLQMIFARLKTCPHASTTR